MRLRGGVCVGLSVKVDTKDGAQLIVGQGITRGTNSGVGQGHPGSDQFLGIDATQ